MGNFLLIRISKTRLCAICPRSFIAYLSLTFVYPESWILASLHFTTFLAFYQDVPPPLHSCLFLFPTLHLYGLYSVSPSLFSSLDILDPLLLLLWTYWTHVTVLNTHLGASGLSFTGLSLSSSGKRALLPFCPSVCASLTPSHPGTHSVPSMFWTLYMLTNVRSGRQLLSGISASWNLRGIEHTCEPGMSVTIGLLKSSETHWN